MSELLQCPAGHPVACADAHCPVCGTVLLEDMGDVLLPGPEELPRVPGYRIVEELGRGGMGVVYKAEQKKLKRTVALKMILAGAMAGPRKRTYFRAEAEALARFQHPNIVQIYQVGEYQGQPYLCLEYVDGGDLARRICGKPQPPQETTALVEVLARAVQAAHEKDVIHRDLKPANILLTEEGAPKITDFGLARHLNQQDPRSRTGVIQGTGPYMAPEQARAEKNIGPAADVYALGVILYEMLTGRPPFQGADLGETLEQVRTSDPVPPTRLQPRLSRDLETICLKCLEKKPARRYRSAAELAGRLRLFQEGKPIPDRHYGALHRLWRWCQRNPVVANLVLALLLVFFAGSAAIGWMSRAHLAAQEKWDRERSEITAGKNKIEEGKKKVEDLVSRYLSAQEDSPAKAEPADERIAAKAPASELRTQGAEQPRTTRLREAAAARNELTLLERQWQEQILILEALTETLPGRLAVRAKTIDLHTAFARWQIERGQPGEAVRDVERAEEHLKDLARRTRNLHGDPHQLGNRYLQIGRLWTQLSQSAKATAAFGQSLAFHRRAQEADRSNPRHQQAVEEVSSLLASSRSQSGRQHSQLQIDRGLRSAPRGSAEGDKVTR